MKTFIKTLLIVLAVFITMPHRAYAQFAVPFYATSTLQNWIQPARVGGLEQLIRAISFIATSTTASIFPYASTTVTSAQALCLTGDLPCRTSWPTFGSTSKWATTTDGVSLYPNGGTNIGVVIGRTATTTKSLLEVNGTTTMTNFVATSTTATSTIAGGLLIDPKTSANSVGTFTVVPTTPGNSSGVTGRVGVGTLFPLAKFHVKDVQGVGTPITAMFMNDDDNNGGNVLIQLSSVSGLGVNSTGGIKNSTTGLLSLQTGSSLSTTEGTNRISILKTGNVGVGDDTPASLLTVGASDAFQVTSAGRALANVGASGAGNLSYSFVGDTGTGFYRSATNEVSAQTNGVTRASITNSTTTISTNVVIGDIFTGATRRVFSGNTIPPSLTVGATNGSGVERVHADAPGSIVHGYSRAAVGGISEISTDTNCLGCFAGGYVRGYSGASASTTAGFGGTGFGNFAFGHLDRPTAPSTIRSTGTGSVAFGTILDFVGTPNAPLTIQSSSQGSLAGGAAVNGSIISSGSAGIAWGNDIQNLVQIGFAFGEHFTNNTVRSFQVGYSATPALTVRDMGVGIGTTTPYGYLSVFATSSAPLAPAFFIASSTGATIFSIDGNGKQTTGGVTPTVSTCGTSPSVVGNDTAGTVTVGAGVVLTCDITFSSPRKDANYAVLVSSGAAIAGGASAKSTTATTITFGATIGGGTFDYHIIGY